jgi:hypothetical protein
LRISLITEKEERIKSLYKFKIMPPKAKELKEVTAVQVFNLDNMNPALLPELATFKEIQLKVVEDNPFIAITDVASRDLAKKYRTARVSARTSLQGQDKLISAKFNEAKTKAKGYIAELIAYTQPGELEQQTEIDRDESVLEAKRQEKARLEQTRIDNIKKELYDYVTKWKSAFNNMEFDSIEEVGSIFLESYTGYDLTVLEEFEALFPSKVEELTQYLTEKAVSLTNEEIGRVEKIRLENEAKLARERNELQSLRLKELLPFNSFGADVDMATLWVLSETEYKCILDKKKEIFTIDQENKIEAKKLADEAEAKAKAEREAFEKEKADFAAKQAEAAKQAQAQTEAIKAMHEAILPPAPEAIKVIDAEILVPEIPTVNVCSPIMEFEGPTKDNPSNMRITPLTPEECFAPTWKSIQEDFKTSGQKSYSKFLVDNYNVPTKL